MLVSIRTKMYKPLLKQGANKVENVREAQNNELQKLKIIFGENLQDMRSEATEGNWEPLNITIKLRPGITDGFESSTISISMHVKCEPDYPNTIPQFWLEGNKDSADNLIVNLTEEINKKAELLKGQTMIAEMAQLVQASLQQLEITKTLSVYGDIEIGAQKSTVDEDYFIIMNRKIYKGRSLNYSPKGCVAYSGIDSGSGKLLLITEWMIKYSQLEALCAFNCKNENSANNCTEHGVDEVIANIKNQMLKLVEIRHVHLVHYEYVHCAKTTNGILVHLAQDFVMGNSVANVKISSGWCERTVRLLTRSILEALLHLQNNNVNHGLLNDTTVYMENNLVRVTDFALVPYLQKLVETEPIKRPDLKGLGMLIESLLLNYSPVMTDFIEMCKSDRTLLEVNLLGHPFLLPLPNQSVSRIQHEYTNLVHVGEGAFGDVYKAIYNLDNCEYAIKRIPLMTNINNYISNTKEVEVLSKLDNLYIVRYFTSWIETNPNYMYIQMEYCDGSTLAHAIDNNLNCDPERVWRLFTELVHGLAYIHQKNVIHRDLKPDNVFITSHDHIKIGDFGIACYYGEITEEQKLKSSFEIGRRSSEDQDIVRKMYTPPQRFDNRSQYDPKADMYQLGIILFEMSFPPFDTVKQRQQTLNILINSLSCENIPEAIETNEIVTNIRIIKMLLRQEACERPSAEELLSTELISLSKSESLELNKIMNDHQSKKYKTLIDQCLQQECNILVELTYSHVPFHKSVATTGEFVKLKVLKLFQKHGGCEIIVPLLTPCSSNSKAEQNTVRLMTRSGSNVYLPSDVHLRFARYVILNRINLQRRYSFEQLYCENNVSNFHPKRSSECCFDIITESPGDLFVGAELMSMAYDITREIPMLQQRNVSIQINHSNILKALLLYFKIPVHKHAELCEILLNVSKMKITKLKFKQLLKKIIPENCDHFYRFTQKMYSLTDFKKNRLVLEGEGEVASLIKVALQDLHETMHLINKFGVTCSIFMVMGLQISYEPLASGGIIWQMVTEDKFSEPKQRIIAAGQCYDSYLSEYRKFAHNNQWSIRDSDVGGVGFSFFLDNLVKEITPIREYWTTLDVVCVHSAQQSQERATVILNLLWAADIRSGGIKADNVEEARVKANSLGARLIVTPDENYMVNLTLWMKNLLQEWKLHENELVSVIQNLLQSKEESFTFRTTGENQNNSVLQDTKNKLAKKKKKSKALPRLNWYDSHN